MVFMLTSELTTSLIIVAIVIFAIGRQVMPQRIRRLSFVFLPLVAAYEAYRSLPRPVIPIPQIVECVILVAAALAVGVVQSAYTRVYFKNNQLYMQGGFVTLIAWVALMIIRFIVAFMFQGVSVFTSYHNFEWILWAAVAAAFGSRSLILYMRHPEIAKALAEERANRRRR
jgi:hypothetical protein